MRVNLQRYCTREYLRELPNDITHIKLSISDEDFRRISSLFLLKWEDFLVSDNMFLRKFQDKWVNILPNRLEGSNINRPSTNNALESFNKQKKEK